MIEVLKIDDDQDDQHGHSKKASVYLKTFTFKLPQDCVTLRSMNWFKMVEHLHDFLEVYPNVWHDNDYKQPMQAVGSLSQ